MGVIILKKMEFFAYHGCFAEEQLTGTKFRVDLQLEVDATEAELNDDLSKTIDYQKVYNIVKQQMEIKSKLLENIARRIADTISNQFTEIKKIEITVTKNNPPLGGKVSGVSYKLTTGS